MATQVIAEKLTGLYAAPTLPLFVYDDSTPPADLSLADAITAVNGASTAIVPTTINSIPSDGNPAIRRLSSSSFRFEINYRVPNLKPLSPPASGTTRNGFNFQLPRKYVRFAPEVDIFPDSEPSWHGLVNVKQDCHSGVVSSGIWLDPPPVSFTTEMVIALSTVTASWIRTLAAVIQAGTVNSTSLQSGAYEAGEIMIGYCSGQMVSADAVRIETGWCWQQNVTGETRDGVTGIEYDGHDFVWEWTEPFCDRNNNQLGLSVRAVYVNQVRPRADISGIGILPP